MHAAAAAGSDNTKLLYGGIALFVLILAFITYMLIQNARIERELIRQVQEMAQQAPRSPQDSWPLPTWVVLCWIAVVMLLLAYLGMRMR